MTPNWILKLEVGRKLSGVEMARKFKSLTILGNALKIGGNF